jgi:purine-cytosine permease-like protein
MNNLKPSKLIKIIILLIIILSVLIYISFCINEQNAKAIGYAFNWFSTLSTFITLLIAILLFEKYGLKKKISDKREDKILELLDTISSLPIEIQTNRKGGSVSSSFNPTSSSSKSEILKDFHNKEILLSKAYFDEIIQLKKYYNYYWMPKEIKTALSKIFEITIVYYDNLQVNSIKYVRIGINNQTITNEIYGELRTNNLFNMTQYYKLWNDLDKEILTWLNKNSDFKIKK